MHLFGFLVNNENIMLRRIKNIKIITWMVYK